MTRPLSALARKGYLELVLKRLGRHVYLSPSEKDAIRALDGPRQTFAKGQRLAGAENGGLQIVLNGWACKRRRLTSDLAQMFELILPGDVIGDMAPWAGQPPFECLALTVVTLMDASALLEQDGAGSRVHDGIAAGVAALHRQAYARLLDHVVRLGSHDAYASIGHLLVELYDRQHEVGLATGPRMPMLIGQERLADLMGLSGAHVNRTMKRLREDGQVIPGAGWMILPKLEILAEQVGYAGVRRWSV
jgi:CRP-like cAMP-binding protein